MQYGKKDYADAWDACKEALVICPTQHLSSFCVDNGYLISSMRKGVNGLMAIVEGEFGLKSTLGGAERTSRLFTITYNLHRKNNTSYCGV